MMSNYCIRVCNWRNYWRSSKLWWRYYSQSCWIFSCPYVWTCLWAGLTTLDGMDNDLESLYEGDISLTPPPIINGLTTLTFLEDLSHYLRSLPISLLPSVPGTLGTNISDLVKLHVNLSTSILKVRKNNPILMARFNIYLNFYFMAHYFHYIH